LIEQLVSKISNLCDPDPPTLQTDRQTDGRTDGRHAISIPRYALVHRAVKTALMNKGLFPLQLRVALRGVACRVIVSATQRNVQP